MAREDAALTRHVKDLWPDLEHLFEVGEQASQLRGHQGWSAVQALLSAETDAVSAQMEERTTPLNQADYALRHGRIGGLRAAQRALDAIIETAERRRSEQQAKHEGAGESASEG